MLWVLAVCPGSSACLEQADITRLLGSGEACPRILKSRGEFASLAFPVGVFPSGCASCSRACWWQKVSACQWLHRFMAHLWRRAVTQGCLCLESSFPEESLQGELWSGSSGTGLHRNKLGAMKQASTSRVLIIPGRGSEHQCLLCPSVIDAFVSPGRLFCVHKQIL